MKILIFLSIFISFASIANTIEPFDTDGCTLVPDGTFTNPTKWNKCCLEHDISYWKGGTRKERKETDKKFRACLKDFGTNSVAFIYYYGVRVGGHPYSRQWFSWGYGWEDYRGYRELNEEERAQVKELMPEVNF
jgi:hypothetical protein